MTIRRKPPVPLIKIATASWNAETFKIPAALGYVRMIELDPDSHADEKVERYREAMELFDYPSVKKLVLSGVSKTRSIS